MVTKEYAVDGEIIIVEELTRAEFLEAAADTVEAVEECGSDDDTLWIEYSDGGVFSCGYGDPDGKRFRKAGIAWGCIGNSATWQVFGEYAMRDDGIPERAI